MSLKSREEGNKLYGARDFEGAIKKYCLAARMSKEDPVPLRNLSATYFEVGEYKICIAFAKKALTMTRAVGGDDLASHVQKLEARIARAEEYSQVTPIEQQKKRRMEILERLERYHQSTQLEIDYSPVSHNNAQSLFDPDMKRYALKDVNLSFFNAGIGDARNFFYSLIHIAHDEEAENTSKYRYHFTLNDANRHILARDLILFKLLDKLSGLPQPGDEALKVLNTIFFTFIAPIMPECAFRQLQDTISELLNDLKGTHQALKWVHLSKEDIPLYIGALKNWTSEGQVLKTFSTEDVVMSVTRIMKKYYDTKHDDFQEMLGRHCVQERKVYIQNGMLLPPNRIMQLEESFMLDFFPKSGPTWENKDCYELKSWSLNPTMFDIDWHSVRDLETLTFGVRQDPFDLVTTLAIEGGMLPQRKKASRLFDHVAPFFEAAARAIKNLGARLQAEVVLGDYIDVAERLNFDLYYDPNDVDESKKLDCLRSNDFPLLYDCIELSNLPDYKGGNLTTFLHVLPILKPNGSSSIFSVCLRNPHAFPNMGYFMSEYLIITGRKMLDQLTGACIESKGNGPFPLADVTVYQWYPRNNPYNRPISAVLPRERMKVWFYGLFLKLALPMQSLAAYIPKTHEIYSPLNLSILFRQLAHLRLLGYPSHWLSDVLVPLFSSTITTTARPPRYTPMEPRHVSAIHPTKQLCIAPFSPEMKTLAAIFAPILPFRLDPSVIYSLDEIHECTVSLRPLPLFYSIKTHPTCLILLFWRPGSNPNGSFSLEPDNNLRALLDPSWGDEVHDFYEGRRYENWRAKDVIVWSTFKYDIMKREAKVWMPKSLVDQMVNDEWKCALWRRDIWQILGGPKKVEAGKVGNIMKIGRKWDEDQEDEDREDEDVESDDDESDDKSDEEVLAKLDNDQLDDPMFQALLEEFSIYT
ncbi:hypothetical protein EYC80_008632 [Monilinia laxa]|uniref:DUF4470 domain-containing protein n=1 Tax=Monilinia laxa TaxID=61186 RepID=A0A5N6K0X9_MONLA|nr:hypothetical protein EYC80_008632 [Monilinia laxa]